MNVNRKVEDVVCKHKMHDFQLRAVNKLNHQVTDRGICHINTFSYDGLNY